MEIHTDEPKVAAILVAWEMTKLTGPGYQSDDTPNQLREAFERYYTAIATVAKIDSHQRKPGTSQG